MIKEGTKAPAFDLESSAGGRVQLEDLAGDVVVLYFYPRDNTPGCATEAEAFRDELPALTKAGAKVFGISKDSIASHGKFVAKYALTFPLLADPEGTMLEAYGAWGEKTLYGRTFMGIIRSTVIVGRDGKVAKVYPKVSVKTHAADVLEDVKALGKAAKK